MGCGWENRTRSEAGHGRESGRRLKKGKKARQTKQHDKIRYTKASSKTTNKSFKNIARNPKRKKPHIILEI